MAGYTMCNCLLTFFCPLLLVLTLLISKEITSAQKHSSTNASTTLVTALYRFASKHSYSEYLSWSRGFLQARSNLVVFTTDELLPTLRLTRRQLCGIDCPTIWRTEFNSPLELPIFKNISQGQWRAQLEKDPERMIHRDYQLYGVWLGKAGFLKLVALENPFGSAFFLWVDIGIFRTEPFLSNTHVWPSLTAVKAALQLDTATRGRMLISLVRPADSLFCEPPQSLRDERLRNDATVGGILGGTARAIVSFYRLVSNIINENNEQAIFFGKDQLVYNYLLSTRPENFLVYKSYTDSCEQSWSLMTFYFSDERPLSPDCNAAYIPSERFFFPDRLACRH